MIVGLTMAGFGVLVFRLIGSAEAGRTDAQASAVAGIGVRFARNAAHSALPAARRAARDPALQEALRAGDRAASDRAAARLRRITHSERVQVLAGDQVLADAGPRDAIAPALQPLVFAGSGRHALVLVSDLRAGRLVGLLAPEGGRLVVSRGRDVLAARTIPSRDEQRTEAASAPDFSGARVKVSLSLPVRAGRAGTSRAAALAVLFAFGALALAAGLAVSRGLHRQVQAFLAAARRIGQGDFSVTVPVEGRDEFGQLGEEFNRMAEQLAARMQELGQERGRLRDSIRRIGQIFVANLDRRALVELSLRTAVDAAGADGGRATLYDTDALTETARAGVIDGAGETIRAAEARAVTGDKVAVARQGDVHALAVALRPAGTGKLLGALAVARAHSPFSDAERDLLQTLAGQTAASVENAELHELVRHQAVTDDVTDLANHRRFQEALAAELQRSRRFGQDVGLVMLDVDDFKAINDTWGHQQGDAVLRAVAQTLRDCSRDVDEPGRSGGDELAVVLPETDLEGAWRAAERVRKAVAGVQVPRLDGPGALRVTVSVGVAAGCQVPPAELVRAADEALLEAKRTGKNRTVRGEVRASARVRGR